MLLTTILLFVGVSVLAHIIPTAYACVILFLSRAEHLIGAFSNKPPTEGEPAQNRTIRRRLEREQKRIAKAKQHGASSFPISISRKGSGREEAFPVFLSMPYFLSATANEDDGAGYDNWTRDGQGPPEPPDGSVTPPNLRASIAKKHSPQHHVYVSAQPDCILTWFHYLLLLMAKLGYGVWNTVVDIFCWARNWVLAPTCYPYPYPNPASPGGPANHPSGDAKGKRKSNGKEKATKRRKQSGKNNKKKNNDDDGGSGESDEETHKGHGHGPGNGEEEECPPDCFFGCPFYKLDPVRHYRCLEKYKLKRYSDVKQHILRCHVLEGFYYCLQCLAMWEFSEPWEAHVNSNECQDNNLAQSQSHSHSQSRLLDGLLPGEADCLEPTPRGLNDYQRWYWMWQQIFSDHEPPASPFVKDGIAEPASLFTHRGMTALSLMLPALLPLYNIELDEGTTALLARDIATVYTNAMTAAPQSFWRRVPPTTVGPQLQLAPQEMPPPNISHQAIPIPIPIPVPIPALGNPQDPLGQATIGEAAAGEAPNLGGLQGVLPQVTLQNSPSPSDPILAIPALLGQVGPALLPEKDDIDFLEDQPDTT